MISLSEYNNLKNKGYTHIPLIVEVLTDFDTPLSLYIKLADTPMSYLLESLVGGSKFGRYSYIGLDCNTYIKVYSNKVLFYKDNQLQEKIKSEDVLKYIENFHKSFKVPDILKFLRFNGGLVGYFGYETISHIEKKLSNINKKDKFIDIPDIFLMLSTKLIVLDNLSGKSYLIVYAQTEHEQGYEIAKKSLNLLHSNLKKSIKIPKSEEFKGKFEIKYETGKRNYKKYVSKIKEYIKNGDCMQVVPSQRMYIAYNGSPINIYRALRTINPTPYLIYYNFKDFFIVGSSPELLVKQEGNKILSRPLAGTKIRGKTEEDDKKLMEDLLSDAKEVAEHVMLIDLARNDIGKVSKNGTIKVTEKMNIEKYSHVMHISSSVEGIKKDNVSSIDVLKATFPAGTLSGAPKIRAMEIINELEPTQRGVYGGAIGCWSFNNDMDFAIGIRTTIIKNGNIYIQSGSGVVADSEEEKEWEETQNKALVIIKAIEMIQKGLNKNEL